MSEVVVYSGIDEALEAARREGSAVAVLLEKEKELVVRDEPTLALAVNIVTEAKRAGKDLDARRKKDVKPLNDYVAGINEKYAPYITAAKEAEAVAWGKVKDFEREQERLAKEEERRIEAAREKELQRLAAEEEKLREQGKDALADRRAEKIAVIDALPVTVVNPATVVRKSGGLSSTKVYRHEVTSMAEIVMAAASGNVAAMRVLTINDAEARVQNKAGAKIPGLRFWDEDSAPSARR